MFEDEKYEGMDLYGLTLYSATIENCILIDCVLIHCTVEDCLTMDCVFYLSIMRFTERSKDYLLPDGKKRGMI